MKSSAGEATNHTYAACVACIESYKGNAVPGVPKEGHLIVTFSSRVDQGCVVNVRFDWGLGTQTHQSRDLGVSRVFLLLLSA